MINSTKEQHTTNLALKKRYKTKARKPLIFLKTPEVVQELNFFTKETKPISTITQKTKPMINITREQHITNLA